MKFAATMSILFLALLTAVAGCSGSDDASTAESADQSSQADRGGTVGVTADGKTVYWGDFRDKLVWVDFSAPWCAPCKVQAPIARRIEKEYAGRLVFLTILTSDHNPSKPPTRKNARDWAEQYNLDADHVIAGAGAGVRLLPTHVLMGPTGERLFRHEGLMQEDQMRTVIERALSRVGE